MNILTAVFVENAMKLAQPDRETLALEQRKRDLIEGEELRQLVSEYMDPELTGRVSVKTFMENIRNFKLKSRLRVLGLDIKDAEMFIQLLANQTANQMVVV